MKQGTLITRIVILVLFVAVLAYIGVYLWQGFSDPYRMVASYAYQMDDGASLEGFVVREEQVIEGQTALAEVLPQEGERVAAGEAVAAVYQTSGALENHREAQSLELQLEQLQYAMRRNDNVGDSTVLDNQLVDTLAKIRSGVSANSLGGLEESGLNLRSLVLKRTGDATTSAESMAALQAAASEVESRLDWLNASAAQYTRYVTVDRSGLFSGEADGYEHILTPDALDTVTAAELSQLRSRKVTAPGNALGKLITDNTWHFVTTVDDETAERVSVGKTYLLDFAGDFDRDVPMTLERLGSSEGGRHVAVFSSDRYLGEATLARQVSATLVFQRFTGVRIPDRALRVMEKEEGATTLGVFVLVGRQAEFKPVEIIREGEGFYLVRGTSTTRKVLRAGDVLILSNQELYDGKVVD